jgi:PhnB protein
LHGASFVFCHEETTMRVKPVPDNYSVMTPYLAIDGAAAAIEFYKKAFGATERMRMEAPGGKIGHAEIDIAGGVIMLADEYPDIEFRGPQSRGGTTVIIHVYVTDVDAFCDRAVRAGATLVRAVADQFYGDRSGQLRDPYGHMWSIATHTEDVAPDEMARRAAALHKS